MESTQHQQEVNLFNQIFNAQQIDVLGSVDNPVFITNQICKAIGQKENDVWINRIKEDFQGAEFIGPSEIPTYRSQKLSVITFEGVMEIIYRSRSPFAKKFRSFITELLFNLFRGKIQILVLDKELLEQQNKEYLTRLALTEQSNEELSKQLSQSMQSLAELTGAIQPILKKERVQKTSKKKYWPCLAICALDEDEEQIEVYRLQYYQMNCKIDKKLKAYPDLEILVRIDNVPNDKTLWQACFERLKEFNIISEESKLLQLELSEEANSDDLAEFVQEFYDERMNI